MTNCRFALYDPGTAFCPRDRSGLKRKDGLDVARLDRLYYDVASKHRPPDPNRLLPDDIWGGMAELGDDLIGVYRFFNGGREICVGGRGDSSFWRRCWQETRSMEGIFPPSSTAR